MQAAVLAAPAAHQAVQQTIGLTECRILCTRQRMRHAVLPQANQGWSFLIKSILDHMVYRMPQIN